MLTVPLALLATAVVAGVAKTPVVSLGRRKGFGRLACVAIAGSLVFALGAYVANIALVDDPLQRATLIGCGGAAVAATATMMIAHRKLRSSQLGRKLESVPVEWIVGTAALSGGLGLVRLDASFLSEGYLSFHLALLGLALVCLATFAAIVVRRARGLRVASWSAASVLGLSIVAVTTAHDTCEQMANSATLDRRLLLLARRVLDKDGDGFAAGLGGGDCDDHDPNTFPLSRKGRDCLQFVAHSPLPGGGLERLATAAGASTGPRVILLITVDALRCDSTSPAFVGLPTLCPKLERLAREGRQRVPAHTTYPSTAFATLSLHEGAFLHDPAPARRPLLAEVMKANGRTTHAISTHSKQMPPIIAQSFDSVDSALQSQTRSGSASTAAQVTDHALDWLKHNNSDFVFLWAHYYDPHSPYVDPPGSHSALSPATRRYAAEVRRTDSEVVRLIYAAAALEPSLVALVTADHGEEFGEHGAMYHGTTLYETVVRVPMIAWEADPRFLKERADLPASIAEVAPFLISMARGEGFTSQNEAFFWVASHGKRLLGIYRDPYKFTYDEGLNVSALYNIDEDPAEVRNLVQTHPALRQELGARMAAYLQRPAGEADRGELPAE